jgi:hypothetical protein
LVAKAPERSVAAPAQSTPDAVPAAVLARAVTVIVIDLQPFADLAADRAGAAL